VAGATSYGKTGSAENALGKVTHAWFSGYIVTDKPEIVVTVFLENAGGGGAVAGPICNRIMNYYVGNLESFKKPAPVPEQFRSLAPVDREEITEPETPTPAEHASPPDNQEPAPEGEN